MELQVLISQLCRVCQNQDLNREQSFCQNLDDILPNTQVASGGNFFKFLLQVFYSKRQVSSITASLTACGEDLGTCCTHKVVPRVAARGDVFCDVSRDFPGLVILVMFDSSLMRSHLVANFVIL